MVVFSLDANGMQVKAVDRNVVDDVVDAVVEAAMDITVDVGMRHGTGPSGLAKISCPR